MIAHGELLYTTRQAAVADFREYIVSPREEECMQANLERIKNPLVLIASFAGISEVAMAVTLIQLPEAIQETFVWFVMVFR